MRLGSAREFNRGGSEQRVDLVARLEKKLGIYKLAQSIPHEK
jgi:hypothetical protein